jgi:hypothetical protein
MLHAMEGYLVPRVQHKGRAARKLYPAISVSKKRLGLAKLRVGEFTNEAMKR